jgi:glycine/D-amino acid oxidase-like deaminating enzyme
VVGGGILGVSIAAHLAQRGASVTLLTEHALASGASGRSLSWLNSYGPRTPEYHQLRLAGLDRYRRLAAQIDSSAWLKFEGGLTWPAAGAVEGHRAAFEHMRQVGYDAEWLTPAQVAERTPGVDLTAIPDEGAIFNPGEGWGRAGSSCRRGSSTWPASSSGPVARSAPTPAGPRSWSPTVG